MATASRAAHSHVISNSFSSTYCDYLVQQNHGNADGIRAQCHFGIIIMMKSKSKKNKSQFDYQKNGLTSDYQTSRHSHHQIRSNLNLTIFRIVFFFKRDKNGNCFDSNVHCRDSQSQKRLYGYIPGFRGYPLQVASKIGARSMIFALQQQRNRITKQWNMKTHISK